MKKRNKGEWTEVYSLLKIINSRQIPLSTAEHEPGPSSIRVDKIHNGDGLTFDLRTEGKVKIGSEVHDVKDFVPNALVEELKESIVSGKGRTFEVPIVREFERRYNIELCKAGSNKKADIVLDIAIGDKLFERQGFGVKSYLGKPPTLVNSSTHTNFVFRVNGVSKDMLANIKGLPKLSQRLKALGGASNLEFVRVDSDVFKGNLDLSHPELCETLAAMQVEYYINRKSNLLENLAACGKAGSSIAQSDQIKKFLMDYLLGFFPSKPWCGERSAHGSIEVKKDGPILAFHESSPDEFGSYLLKHTKFDTPHSRNKFGSPYLSQSSGDMMIKLNLQVRFI